MLLSPHPFPLNKDVPFPQQRHSNRMIHKLLSHPFPSPQFLHPQFVVAKSLISDLQIIYFTLYVMPAITNGYRKNVLTNKSIIVYNYSERSNYSVLVNKFAVKYNILSYGRHRHERRFNE